MEEIPTEQPESSSSAASMPKKSTEEQNASKEWEILPPPPPFSQQPNLPPSYEERNENPPAPFSPRNQQLSADGGGRRGKKYKFNTYCLQIVFCGLVTWIVLANLIVYYLLPPDLPTTFDRHHSQQQRSTEGDSASPMAFATVEGVLGNFIDGITDKFGVSEATILLASRSLLLDSNLATKFKWESFARRPQSQRIITFFFFSNERRSSFYDCAEAEEFGHSLLSGHTLTYCLTAESGLKGPVHVLWMTAPVTIHLISLQAHPKSPGSHHIVSEPLNASPAAEAKLKEFGLLSSEISSKPIFGDELLFLNHIGMFHKSSEVNVEKVAVNEIKLPMPKSMESRVDLAREIQRSKFIPCPASKEAASFYQNYPAEKLRSENDQAEYFRRVVRLIVSTASHALGDLNVPFWISSGTLLGWYRQCDVIPYSGDVDIGIFIRDWDEDIIDVLEEAGMQLKMKLGLEKDGLQYSFYTKDVKLDIYFFYPEEGSKNGRHYYWNAATKPETGEKYKYLFPHFDLCWTEFLDLPVRVPCPTLDYIKANYGDDWHKPITKWDWRSSPPNSSPNGQWSPEEMTEAVQVFEHSSSFTHDGKEL